MKTRFQKLLILLILISGVNYMYGQAPKRQIIYSTNTIKLFAVPVETNFDLITELDLARIQPLEINEKTEMIVDEFNDLMISNTFLDKPEDEHDFLRGIGNSKTTKYGTSLYNHNGDEISRVLNPQVNTEFELNENILPYYGIFPFFEEDLGKFADNYLNIGFATSITDEGVIWIINDTLEMMIDPFKMIFEIRTYFEGVLQYSDWKQYQKIDGVTIPKVFVITHYEELTNGIRLQVSEITKYKSYSIIDENLNSVVDFIDNTINTAKYGGTTISQYIETEKKITNPEVFPNPANDKVKVKIPYFISDYIDLEIINTNGTVLLKREALKAGSIHELDIQSLQQGNYIVRCGKADKWKTSKFIKL